MGAPKSNPHNLAQTLKVFYLAYKNLLLVQFRATHRLICLTLKVAFFDHWEDHSCFDHNYGCWLDNGSQKMAVSLSKEVSHHLMSARWLNGMNECKSRELLVDQELVVFWSNFFNSFTRIGLPEGKPKLSCEKGRMWATKRNASKEKAPFCWETIPLWDHCPRLW